MNPRANPRELYTRLAHHLLPIQPQTLAMKGGRAPPYTTPRSLGHSGYWPWSRLVAVLHLARAFFVPLLFGILVSYTLGPIVDWFERYHVPRAIASALVLGALVGGTSWTALSLSADTEAIIERLPEAARKLRQNLHNLLSSSPSTLERVREAAAELENAAVDAGLKSESAPVVITQEPDASTWLRDFILTQAALLVAFAAQAPVVLLLTYFLLAAGTHFRRKLVKIVGPSLTQRKMLCEYLKRWTYKSSATCL